MQQRPRFSPSVLPVLSRARARRACLVYPALPSYSFDNNMISEKLLGNLLEQPFGPYLEETILSDKCKFVQSRPLLLEDFQMAYNNEPTG
jgi:hypothetical protein